MHIAGSIGLQAPSSHGPPVVGSSSVVVGASLVPVDDPLVPVVPDDDVSPPSLPVVVEAAGQHPASVTSVRETRGARRDLIRAL